MWYVRHKESNEPWVGSRGKVKEVDVRQKLVYLIEVYEGWGRGRGGTPKVKEYLRTVSLSVRRTRYYFLYRIYYDVLITGIADY